MSGAVSTRAGIAAPEVERATKLVPYEHAIARMRQEVAEIRAGCAPERLWLVEHPPLYTAGTSSRREDLMAPDRFPTHAAGRGGEWTYHGPGQRVVYVMLDLARPHASVAARDVHAYVAGLEAWLIAALRKLGIDGGRRPGRVGIWVARPDRQASTPIEDKIAAIGVRVTRWVTWHGVALNVDPELEHFSGIVPCGIREHGVTSLRALGCTATMDQVDEALLDSWPNVFGGQLTVPLRVPPMVPPMVQPGGGPAWRASER